MAAFPMVRTKADDTNGGAWWHTDLTVTSGVSDSGIIPVQPIMSVGARVSTSGLLAFTMDEEAKIVAGTANYEIWDGIAQINHAVTGFNLTCVSGTATATVTVKTFYAS